MTKERLAAKRYTIMQTNIRQTEIRPLRANLRFAAWFSEPKVCRTIFKFALIIIV